MSTMASIICSVVSFLLITFLTLSLPASGAMVRVRWLLAPKFSSNPFVNESALREDREKSPPFSRIWLVTCSIQGKSEADGLMRPILPPFSRISSIEVNTFPSSITRGGR